MRVVLSGYYGFDNAGDEALLTAITSSLKRYNPNIEFMVLSGNPAKTEATHGIPAVSRINPLILIREIGRADLLVSGGGSLLQDVTGPFSLPYYLGIIVLARLLGTPVVLYAQGVGPLVRRFSKTLIRAVVNRVELVTLRDEDSRRTLVATGATRPPTRVTADPVFALTPGEKDVAKARGIFQSLRLKPGEPIVGVSVRQWNSLGNYEPGLARVLDTLAEKGHKIIFIPLHYSEDLKQSRHIADMMNHPAVVIDEALTSLQTMALIAHTQLLIGMRLHSLVFAACGGIPFVGLSYDPKVDNFLRLFGQESALVNSHLDVDYLLQAVQRTLNKREQESETIRHQVAYLRERALETARLALEAVGNCHQR